MNAFTLVVSRFVILLLVLSLVLVVGRFLYDRLRSRSPRVAAAVFTSLVTLGFLSTALPVIVGVARAAAEHAYRNARWEPAVRWYYLDWRMGGGRDLVALPNWAGALMQLHRWKAAETVLSIGIEDRPGGVVAIPQYVLMLGICRYWLGEDAAAERDLASVSGSVDTPLIPYYLGRLADRRGDAGAAVAFYRAAIARQPTFFPAVYEGARSLWRSGDSVGARALADDFSRRVPDDPEGSALAASLGAEGPREREFLLVPR